MRRWHKITLMELGIIRNSLMSRGINYAGCTSDELLRLYGVGNVKHVKGRGWYVLRSSVV